MTFRNLLIGLVLLAALVWLSGRITAEPTVGRGDYIAYWSAAYLLADGQPINDRDLLLAVQQDQTGWAEDYAVRVWNPPWLPVLLLPLTWFPFAQAVWLWLFINILLFFVGAALLWIALAQTPAMQRRGWLGALLAFFFAPTLLALIMGQVVSLVFFGLALFFYFYRQEKLLAAGAALALTLIKPHLVYLTLPLLFWLTWRRGQLRLWWGTGIVIVGLLAIGLVLRPTLLSEYFVGVENGRLFTYSPPTLGGILGFLFGWQWPKFMGILLLPLLLWLVHRSQQPVDPANLISVSLLLSIATAPFGWSYDQVLLLFPIFQLVLWAAEGAVRPKWLAQLALFSLLLLNLALYYLRLQNVHEVYYFWLPLCLLILYSWAYASGKKHPQREQVVRPLAE